MPDFIQNVLDGIMVGASYALLGLGFTLMFGVMRRLNLSYGPTITMGVYAGAWISLQVHQSLLLALCVSVLVSVIVGLLVEGICFRAVRSDNPLTSMVSAFAMWMVLEEIIILLTWGRLFPVENPTGLSAFSVGDFTVRGDYFILFVSAVVLMGLIYRLIYRTAYGRAVRAVAADRKAAQLMGINVSRVSTGVFVLTSAFGGFVAFFIAASLHQITPGFGLWATVKGLIVMILGGIGSIPGAIAGGLLLGVIELQALWYLGGGYRDLVAFLVLFLFLVVRPRGILGAGEARGQPPGGRNPVKRRGSA